METEQFGSANGHRYFQMQSEPSISSSLHSFEPTWIFDELPKATVVSVSRPDAADISPFTLSYTVEFQYKQVIDLLLFFSFVFLFLNFCCFESNILSFLTKLNNKRDSVFGNFRFRFFKLKLFLILRISLIWVLLFYSILTCEI